MVENRVIGNIRILYWSAERARQLNFKAVWRQYRDILVISYSSIGSNVQAFIISGWQLNKS